MQNLSSETTLLKNKIALPYREISLKTPSEQCVEENKPLFAKLTLILSLSVSLIGLFGCLGHYFQIPIVEAGIPHGKPISITTSIAILFLGVGLKSILDTHPYTEKPPWLWLLRYLGWSIPLLSGGYWIVKYFSSTMFDLLDISTYGLYPVSLLTAIFLSLSGLALLIFLILQQLEFVVTYFVTIPALIVFNVGLLTLIGYSNNVPLLYGYKIALLSGLAAVLTGLALFVGTLPFKGLFLPLFSDSLRARLLAFLSFLVGFGVVILAMTSIAGLLKQSQILSFATLSQSMRHFYTGIILSVCLIGIAIKVIGLRASRYLSQFIFYAAQRESDYEEESLKRVLQEIISQTENSEHTLTLLTQQIGEYFQVDRCLLVLYDKQSANQVTRLEQYARFQLPLVQVEDLPIHSELLQQAVSNENKPLALVCFDDPSNFPSVYRPYAEKYGVQAALGFDLFQQGRFYGRLVLNYCNAPHVWSEREYQLLREISQIVGVAIRQAAIQVEEKEVQQRLSFSEQRFRLLVEGVKDYAIYFEDASGLIHTWNSGAERLFGYRSEEILGKPFSIFFPEETLETGLFDYELQMAAKEGYFEVEGWRIRKDGSQFYANVVLTALKDSDGNVLGYSNITRDITERKRAEQALYISQKKLADSNRDLEQFAAIASHDLQAPLRKVLIFCDMIYENSKGKVDATTLDLIDRAKRSLLVGQNLVKDILALASLNKEERPFAMVELSEVVYRVLNNLDQDIREARAKVIIESSVPLWVDEIQLEQLLQNLIGNALKYQPPGQEPEIRIAASCPDDSEYCQFSVRDNGIGIPYEQKERIFEPFERLHGKSSIYPGSGVGLAISKRIVERHKGRILVESEPGKSSCFIIQIPARSVYESAQNLSVEAFDQALHI